MTYVEALNFIQSKKSLGVKPGLERVKALLARLGNPQNAYKVIHIAGTNGKGTVAATLARELKKSGYTVGLFTSPWVIDYREQIQLNGAFISEADFAETVTKCVDDACTEFELLTAVMYQFFADKRVDYAVVECGMGGAGDATNVEAHNLSVITAIALDHTDYFGNSLEAIAREKAGILRRDGTCIMYPDNALRPIFEERCQRLVIADRPHKLALVNTVLRELDLPPTDTVQHLPARLEILHNVLLDGGHNVSAAKWLAPHLRFETAVIGMLKDKDVEGYLSVVAPRCKTIIATNIPSERALPAEVLADIAEDFCDNVLVIDNPADAVKHKDLTLVCGSFYLAREVRKYLL